MKRQEMKVTLQLVSSALLFVTMNSYYYYI